MAKYFRYFQKTPYYQQSDAKSVDVVTNIMTRFSLEEEFKNNTSVYNKYTVKDGETPENLAKRFYGEQERHWIILMMNNIVDPFYDWPLEQRTFNTYVTNKYATSEYADTANTSLSGLAWSRQNIHSYFKSVSTTYDQNTRTQIYVIDSETYANTTTGSINIPPLQDGSQITKVVTKGTKSYYDYEQEENEKKREIKVLKPEFATTLFEELLRLTKQRRL